MTHHPNVTSAITEDVLGEARLRVLALVLDDFIDRLAIALSTGTDEKAVAYLAAADRLEKATP